MTTLGSMPLPHCSPLVKNVSREERNPTVYSSLTMRNQEHGLSPWIQKVLHGQTLMCSFYKYWFGESKMIHYKDNYFKGKTVLPSFL